MKVLTPIVRAIRRFDDRQPVIDHVEFQRHCQRRAQEPPKLAIISSIWKPLSLKGWIDNLNTMENKQDVELIVLFVHAESEVVEQASFLLESFPSITILSSDNELSVYQAWNYCISHSSAPLLSNHNYDDRRDSDLAGRQIAFMTANPNVDVGYTDYVEIRGTKAEDHTGQIVRTRDQTLIDLVFFGQNFPHASPVWRSNLHKELGAFNSEYSSSGDTDFWLRCLLDSRKLARIPGNPGYVYFLNPEGLSTRSTSRGALEWSETLTVFAPRIWVKLGESVRTLAAQTFHPKN